MVAHIFLMTSLDDKCMGEAEVSFYRCMTARDRLRAWDVNFFGSSNLTHKSCGIFVASWGFAHCIGTRLVFHNFFISP